MKPVPAGEMRRLERTAIEEFNIPALILMENAGRGISEIISQKYKPCRTAIFVGKGNNGGDGLVAARHLANRGFPVRIFMLEDPARLKSDPLVNYRIVEKMKIPVQKTPEDFSAGLIARSCSDVELVVDAIFGIGLTSDLLGIFEAAVRAINLLERPVVSVDIPSGLDADSGAVHGVAVKATITATLGLPKTGLMAGHGPEYAGKIEVVDIGMPRGLLQPFLDNSLQ